MPFTHLFSNIVNYVELGATHGGYAILFLLSILEAIPLVGTAVPGHVTVILSGFLAKIGLLNIWAVIFLASSGAIIGDTIGFYLGRKYGMNLIERFRSRFFISEEHIEKTRRLVGKHTGKALVIGRFNPITRSLMPFVVGASHSPAGAFWIFNVMGGVAWATSSVAIGYVFGFSYHSAAAYIGKGFVVAVLSTIVIAWGYRFVNIRFHIFRRYELFALTLNIFSFWVIVKMIEDAWAVQSRLALFDVYVNQFMTRLAFVLPNISKVASVISALGGTTVTTGLGALIGLVFLLKKKWRSGVIMLFSIGSAGVMVELMKNFFLRDRPDNALQIILNDPSFPSGHAAMATALLIPLVYLFALKIKHTARREIAIVFGVLSIIAIGLSRLVLNVHWASDIIAGWSLGIFCATAVILLVRYVGALAVKSRQRKKPI